MFGNLSNLAGLVRTAKEFQGNMAKLQEELLKRRYEGEAGAGMVQATVNGKGMLLEIKINPQAVGDIELLEDLIKAAVNAAGSKAQQGMKDEMTNLTGGIQVPGLQDLLGGAQAGGTQA